MSIECIFIPGLISLPILFRVLMEENRRATLSERMHKGVLTEEQAADMRLEVEALKRAGCDIRQGSYANLSDSPVVIHTDKGYDIGLRRNEGGAYDIVTGWSSKPGKVEVQKVRQDIEDRIRQKYAYEAVKHELAKKGFMIAKDETEADGTIRLVARKW